MMEETKMRDLLKSTFKETPKSFHNAVNNAIAEAVNADYENYRQFEKDKSIILPNTHKDSPN